MANFKDSKIQFGFLSTATSGGILTLTASSKQLQIFTGTLTHSMVLPDATTTNSGSGIQFTVINLSTGAITVQDNGANLIKLVAAGSACDILLTDHSTSNGVWRVGSFSSSGGGGAGSTAPGSIINVGTRALFAGGGTTAGTSSALSIIDYVAVNTGSTATGFGNLSIAKNQMAGCSSSTVGLFCGGWSGSVGQNAIEMVTIASLAAATSFGNLTSLKVMPGALSSATRGVIAGGANGSALNTIDYVTIATPANATSFGTLTATKIAPAGAASTTRGVFLGGYNGSATVNSIEYITIASTGNGTSFGTMTTARTNAGACSNATRAIVGSGDTDGNCNNTNSMEYITIASTGNATSFGNLSANQRELAAAASSINGIFAGGGNGSAGSGAPTPTAVIDTVVIATTSNSVSFGSLSTARKELAGCSNAHGGL